MKYLFLLFAFLLSCSFVFAEEQKIEKDDFNFDGYEDYRVFIMRNGRMNIWEYFLFNPSIRDYQLYEKLTDLWNPRFKKDNQTIVTFAPGGHASKIYVSNTYTWQNGDIYLMKSIKQDWDIKKELYVRIIMKRTDGEMAVDDFSVLTEDEVELDQK